ncbi:MAG TPA: Rieske (2Fe-2S) protein, partial [Chthonomonadaceae bacterium]|nr:Rieske (2Fe-2S) protein [Chthonomonadaceae bacterium]
MSNTVNVETESGLREMRGIEGQDVSNYQGRFAHACRLDEVAEEGCRVVELDGQSVALFRHGGELFAVDNRCPHMGFPLHQGTVDCGILTCHWHHARFDLASGGAFDPWADDVRSYPVRIDDGEIFVDMAPPAEPPAERFSTRLSEGLKRNLSLIIAKALIGLHACGAPDTVALAAGAEFGTRNSSSGWASGLTILTAMGNILPYLDDADRPRALYHGLRHVAQQTAGRPPAFPYDSLPDTNEPPESLKSWF